MRASFLIACAVLCAAAQQQVDLRQTYERIYVVVPLTGSGTKANPRHPMYAPLQQAQPPGPNGIIAWACLPSDDGKSSLCEFVAGHRAAFAPILADKNVKPFRKGLHGKAEIETEFKKHRKDFELDRLIVRLP